MFIELTDVSGNKFFVNINHILAVTNTYHGLALTASNDVTTIIQEPYDEIKRLIAHEVAAERGY